MAEDTKSDTEALKGTEEDNEVTAEGDPVKAAVEAALSSERVKLAEEAQEKANRELEKRRRDDDRLREEGRQADTLRQSFGLTVRQIRDNLKKVKVYDSDTYKERSLTDEEIESLVIQPVQRYNLVSKQAASFEVLSSLTQAAISSLPEESREDFLDRATGKPIDEWLKLLADHMAPTTSWAKKTKAELEAAAAAADARGYERGKKAPAVPPAGADGKSVPSTGKKPDLKTASGLARARADGLIDDKTFLEHWRDL